MQCLTIDQWDKGFELHESKLKRSKKQSPIINVTPAHMSNIENGNKSELAYFRVIANAHFVFIDTLLCDNLNNTKVVFERGAKHIFKDCSG